MTPELLQRALQRLPGTWPELAELYSLRDALEMQIERRPELENLLLHTHRLACAGEGLPPEIMGIRRESVIRWDSWSSTWQGTDIATGLPARIRILRKEYRADPVLRRRLLREGERLARVLPLRLHRDPDVALIDILQGLPLHYPASSDQHRHPDAVARLFASGVLKLQAFDASGVGLPDLEPSEWILSSFEIRPSCLTIAPQADRPPIPSLCRAITAWWGNGPSTLFEPLLEGYLAFPPESLQEVSHAIRHAFATELAAKRHRLAHQLVRFQQLSSKDRLRQLIRRLEVAVAVPQGRGAIGVDLEGRTTIIESSSKGIFWGPMEQPHTKILDPIAGIQAPEARRLLRARAASPQNLRLQASVSGDAAFVDIACQWISATLHIRTLRLLLETAP